MNRLSYERTNLRFFVFGLGSAFCLLSTSGCSLISTPTPTSTPTFTSTFTPSNTPTSTPTPTFTSTPTDSPTPTITLTPTPAYNAPGTYKMENKCNTVILVFGERLSDDSIKYHYVTFLFCVTYVKVSTDNTMEFGMYFLLTSEPDLEVDVGYRPMKSKTQAFLTDDAGNRYEYLQASGCPPELIVRQNSKNCSGIYLFPGPRPEARSFVLHYYDNQYYRNRDFPITDIVLVNPE